MRILLMTGHHGPEVLQLKAALSRELGADAAAFAGLAQGDLFDSDTDAAVRRWQAGMGIVADGVAGPYGQSLLGLLKLPPLTVALDLAAVRRLFPATKPSNIARYLPYVSCALAAAGLTDAPMVLAGLGTIRAESEGFVPISEFPSQFNTRPGLPAFSAYEGARRLGNTQPGDGARFRGRGFVQLTGRDNYERYGQRIGADLAANADWANAPEVAAVLLALFLSDKAGPMRAALAASDYGKARKLVNGGLHGLSRFQEVFTLAQGLWQAPAAPAPTPVRGPRVGRGVAKAAVRPEVKRALNTRRDPVDLRDRPYQPAPVTLPDEWPRADRVDQYLPVYTRAGLILDQGQEGACTGFGLACVVNYARWIKAGTPQALESVSPRMLYNFARRYDEYAGEDYDGSSCRGALKGWFHHGVCLESDWPYEAQGLARPRYGYAARAAEHTLGVYYRIDTRSITDLQAAILEVGAVFVSAFTHDGWQQLAPLGARTVLTHDSLPVIVFDGRPSTEGGHAFALVGFNTHGFVLQNSWGRGWGAGGFAVLRYDDWLANGMDAWVASLGVRGVVVGRLASAAAPGREGGAAAAREKWWSEATAYEHSVVTGDDGRVRRYVTQDELSRGLLYQACGMPDQWFRTDQASPDGRKRLVIYAHGGLNREAAAIERARAMGHYFTGNGCYPLFLVWKTGLLDSLRGILAGTLKPEPRAGSWRDATDASDLLLEKTLGRPLARPVWSEMKENAAFSCDSGRGGDLLVTALKNLLQIWGDRLDIHLVGHSAGAILLGHLLGVMAQRGLAGRVASIHLFAPACTVAFANRHYAPHEALMKRMYLYNLSQGNERDDTVGGIYRKSLLYLVSNALEPDVRTPLLGMAAVRDDNYRLWDGSSGTADALGAWRNAAALAGLNAPDRTLDIASPKVAIWRPSGAGQAAAEQPAGHGSFDNNIDVIQQALQRITGAQLAMPVDDLRGF